MSGKKEERMKTCANCQYLITEVKFNGTPNSTTVHTCQIGLLKWATSNLKGQLVQLYHPSMTICGRWSAKYVKLVIE